MRQYIEKEIASLQKQLAEIEGDGRRNRSQRLWLKGQLDFAKKVLASRPDTGVVESQDMCPVCKVKTVVAKNYDGTKNRCIRCAHVWPREKAKDAGVVACSNCMGSGECPVVHLSQQSCCCVCMGEGKVAKKEG